MLHYKWIDDSFSRTFLSVPLPHVSSLSKGERDEQHRYESGSTLLGNHLRAELQSSMPSSRATPLHLRRGDLEYSLIPEILIAKRPRRLERARHRVYDRCNRQRSPKRGRRAGLRQVRKTRRYHALRPLSQSEIAITTFYSPYFRIEREGGGAAIAAL